MSQEQMLPLTADDVARIEHRAMTACESPKRNPAAYRLAVDVLRLLGERRRLLTAGRGETSATPG
jgi:hypothetical protein